MGLFNKKDNGIVYKERKVNRNEINRMDYVSSHSFKGFNQLYIASTHDEYIEGRKLLYDKYAPNKAISGIPVSFVVHNHNNKVFIELIADGFYQGIIWQDNAHYKNILDGNVEKICIYPENNELRYFIKLK